MKMFKKIAATVMAAAMSLALLTACGGGSGSGASTKLASIFGSGKLWMDVTDVETNENQVTATDGKKLYLAETDPKDPKGVFEIWVQNGTAYISYGGAALKTTKYDGSPVSELMEDYLKKMPSKETLAKVEIGKYTVNDVEYYAETIKDGDDTAIFCFNGNTPVYCVEKDKESETIFKVNKLTSSFDESKLNPPTNVEFIDADKLGK